MIIRARIDDAARFAEYTRVVPPLVARFGGKYRVVGGPVTVLEGNFPAGWTLVISEWPDIASARRFWDSSEYREAIQLREGTGEFEVTLVPGIEALNATRNGETTP